jgi:flagellar capping protein FliD
LIHTFKEEYVTRAKALNSSIELDLHVNDIMEQAKESMSQDATAIRMQTQNFIDKKNRLLSEAHTRCEATLAVVHSRMKDASKAYGDAYEEALNQQLKNVIESTITEDTLNQEMVIAANAHRDSI